MKFLINSALALMILGGMSVLTVGVFALPVLLIFV